MGNGMLGFLTNLLKLKKFFALGSDKRIDRAHLMEFSSKWEEVEDYNYHFEYDVTNSNQRLFVPVRTFISITDEMKIIQGDLAGTGAKLKDVSVMVYKGAKDTVVGNEVMDKLIVHVPGGKIDESAPELGHSLMNHKIERGLLA
jgi:hypothetical protein